MRDAIRRFADAGHAPRRWSGSVSTVAVGRVASLPRPYRQLTLRRRPMDLLRLVALDQEDLAVVSAHLQDADRARRGSRLLASRAAVRPRRAALRLGGGPTSRRDGGSTGLHFERVSRARCRGIDRTKPDAVLNLLGIDLRGDRRAVRDGDPALRERRRDPARPRMHRDPDEGSRSGLGGSKRPTPRCRPASAR